MNMGEEGAADSRGPADAGGISGSCAPGWGQGAHEDGVRGFDRKVRAKTVDRRRWYELPEEVYGGP